MEEIVLKLISFETYFKKIQMKNCYRRNRKNNIKSYGKVLVIRTFKLPITI